MLIYLYCLIDSNVFNAESATELIQVESLFAVISNKSESEFGEDALKTNLSNLNWVEQTVRRHENVIEYYRQHATLLPFKFPTLFASRRSLVQFLNSRTEQFSHILQFLKEKEEWGVKVYIGSMQLQDFLTSNEEIKKIDDELNNASVGRAYLLKKKREMILSNHAVGSLQQSIDNIFQRLKKHSVKSLQNPLLPKIVTERVDEMILNGAFLLDIHNVKWFLSEAEALKAAYPFLTIEVSGAWAAYNFSN